MANINGIIYKITCDIDNKIYIGQTVNFIEKHKNGKKYLSSYGIDNRMKNHIYKAKKGSTSPLHKSIKDLGEDNFTISLLEECELRKLDELESYYIKYYNSLLPNGFNSQKGGGNYKKHDTKIEEYKKMVIKSIEIKPIKSFGSKSNVRIYILLDDNIKKRIMFYSGERTYLECIYEAREFVNKINTHNVEVIDRTLCDDFLSRYQDKINIFQDKEVIKVRLVNFKYKNFNTVAVYVRTSEMTKQSEEKRINFGGKTINISDAYNMALTFSQCINPNTIIISESLKQSIEVSNSEMPK